MRIEPVRDRPELGIRKINRGKVAGTEIYAYICRLFEATNEFFNHYNNKNLRKMKAGIHPQNYRIVAFKDMSNDHVFLCRSAVSTKETIEVNGETYPVYKMEISNTSHPFYTGKMKLVDTAGRVDKFMSRYAKRYDKKNANK